MLCSWDSFPVLGGVRKEDGQKATGAEHTCNGQVEKASGEDSARPMSHDGAGAERSRCGLVCSQGNFWGWRTASGHCKTMEWAGRGTSKRQERICFLPSNA